MSNNYLFCDVGVDNLEHLFCTCTKFNGQRDSLWVNLISSMPRRLCLELEKMGIIFLLAGFNSGVVTEWTETFAHLVRFILEFI